MAQVRCPVCGRSFDSEQSSTMPFCGERCRTVDLHRWLDEGYGLPSLQEETPEEEWPEPPSEE